MPGFGDTTFIVLLALLLFGPKKLPVLARQLGKLMGDFRRASNEFRTQMEEELRIAEQAERQKQVAAIEAAAPKPAELPQETAVEPPANGVEYSTAAEPSIAQPVQEMAPAPEETTPPPMPIASAGELNLMPPSTGLPVANNAFRTRTETAVHENGSNGEQAAVATPAGEAQESAEARPWMI